MGLYRSLIPASQARVAGVPIHANPAVKSFANAPFMRLRNAADLMPGNASRTCLEIERE